MKKNKVIILVTVLAVIAVGIGLLLLNQAESGDKAGNTDISGGGVNPGGSETAGNDQNGNIPGEKKGYYFEYRGIRIGINDEAAPIIEALGKPMHYFEAPSCAFEGMDKIYSYSGFEFTTYTKNNKDYIASLFFLDDTVTTREGITLNATLDDIVAAYGSDYEQNFNEYSYSDGNCILSFILENGKVVSVEYSMIADNSNGG